MAQKNKICEALDRSLIVGYIHLVGFGRKKVNIASLCPPYPLYVVSTDIIPKMTK